jgi:hypothetical protein
VCKCCVSGATTSHDNCRCMKVRIDMGHPRRRENLFACWPFKGSRCRACTRTIHVLRQSSHTLGPLERDEMLCRWFMCCGKCRIPSRGAASSYYRRCGRVHGDDVHRYVGTCWRRVWSGIRFRGSWSVAQHRGVTSDWPGGQLLGTRRHLEVLESALQKSRANDLFRGYQ